MRQHRVLMLCVGAIMMVGCSDDTTGVIARPPLAGVRFINALADTFDIDIRPQDTVGPWAASASALAYRASTEYWPTEAGARHFRMFPQPGAENNPDPAVVSQVLLDTTVTFEADVNYTVLVTGSARNNTEKFVVIRDDVGEVPAGSIALRAVNASTGAVSLYVTSDTLVALPGTPTFAAVAPDVASPYITRTAGNTAARASAAGAGAVSASVVGPLAAAPPATSPANTVFPAGGVDAAGSGFSVIYFPSSVAGSKAKPFANPGLVFYLDKHPPR